MVQLLEYSFIEEYGCTQETLDNLQAIIDKSNTLDIEAIDYLQILVCDLEAKIPFSLKSLNFVESIGEKLQ
ncbi:MAG: hypothetical protein Q8P72_04730 [Candidatus Roizmanbacteria bacterium]|nr:hypothetical protein [Candidatus Roizmanbacteria bacterium]